jgi:hypothetical protein
MVEYSWKQKHIKFNKNKMPRRTPIKKTKKIIPIKPKLSKKDLRFDLSLVILIGMLTFSSLLLLVSLNKSIAIGTGTKTFRDPWPKSQSYQLKKPQSQVIDDSALGYTLKVPVQMGKWFYKAGAVKSLTDDSLSNQYLRIYIPLSEANSNNLDQQYKDVLTIRKFTAEEWSDIQKSCKKEETDICDAAGKMISSDPDAAEKNNDSVYTYTQANDCPGSLVARCSLANEIVKSFSLK